MGSFFGKVCVKHPDANGKRFDSSKKCVYCCYERNNKLRKSESQLHRMREYQRSYELKGGPGYEAKKRRNKEWFEKNKGWLTKYCSLWVGWPF